MARKVTDTASTWQDATTIPGSIEGVAANDPRRSWDGPDAKGALKLRDFLLLELGTFNLYLSAVGDEQAQRVSRERFAGEAEYNERVIDVLSTFTKLLPKYAFSAANLQRRLERCKSLDQVIVVLANLLVRLQRSAHLEWSNLTKLSDAVVTDLELQVQRPVLDPDLRVQLAQAAALPLETWQTRQAGIAQTRADNKTLREQSREELQAEIAAANARAADAERRLKELEERLGAAPLSPPPAPGPSSLTRAQPSRRSRKRQ